jgi:pimeloyl-ACP methyl ester carboxylesterase
MPIARVNGIEMHYEVRGSGPPLLLLHGFTGSGGDWIHLFDMENLARRFRLVIPDARGHGRSTNPSGEFTHRRCAEDVLALVAELNIDRFCAVGLSLGGNTLLHLATARPELVEAMVLIGAPSYFPKQAREIMTFVGTTEHTEAEWAVMRQRHVQGDEQIRALWRIAGGFAQSYDDMTFTPPHLANIRARTLIVTGDRDPLYPLEIFVEQYRAIPGSSLYVIPGGGHDAVFGPARGEFARLAIALFEPPSAAPAAT